MLEPLGDPVPPLQPRAGHRRRAEQVGILGRETEAVQVFVSPKLALDGGLSLGVGKMGHVKVDGQRQDWGTPDNTTTTRVRFGANWYP